MRVSQAIRASLDLLTRRDRRLLGLSVVVQMATSILDLAGVMLIGLVGALSTAAVQGQQRPKFIGRVASAFGLGDLSVAALLGVISGAAAVLMLLKSVISPILIARVFRFLAHRQATVSARLCRELLSRPLTLVQKRSTQETAGALLQGVNCATVIVLGQTVVAASEIALLITLAFALLLVDTGVALGAIIFFAVVGFSLQKVIGQRMSRVSEKIFTADIASLSTLQEALGAYREITVSVRRPLYVERFRTLRGDSAQASANSQVLSLLPKYVSEAALVLGAVSLALVLFTTRPIPVAAGTLALFLTAATRIMPSILRLQQATLAIRGATGPASFVYTLAEDLGRPVDLPFGATELPQITPRTIKRGYPGFVPCIDLHDVNFSYPSVDGVAIERITMHVGAGQSVALVGRSGAGKSTLADLILGVLEPDMGELTVGGLAPAEAVKRWPGAIAYVPQDVMLANDSVRANVALGIPPDFIDDDLVWDALRRAHLEDYMLSQPDGLETQVGERGLNLSGGQRQRLGIARALFTRPRLLVLDEATSALDAESELAITAMLDGLEEDVTTVIIAHRLSTIRNVDLVMYVEDGEVQARGRFDEVCEQVPALRRQATLMGLRPRGTSAPTDL